MCSTVRRSATAPRLLCPEHPDQPVANALERFDVARPMGVVAQPPAQARDMPGERVVSELGDGSPERIRDLAIRDPCACSCGQDVEEGVLVWRQPNLARALTDTPSQGINFKIGNLKRNDPRLRRRWRFHAAQHRPGWS